MTLFRSPLFRFVATSTLLFLLGFFGAQFIATRAISSSFIKPAKQPGTTLGAHTTPAPSLPPLGEPPSSPSPGFKALLSPTDTASPSSSAPSVQPLSQSHYTIALFGDSMIETLADSDPALEQALHNRYPDVDFTVYNYGIGAENVSQGLARIDQPFDRDSRHYPSLSQLHPDVLIIGSFAYNPYFPYNRDQHWLTLAKLLETAQRFSLRVYLLTEIAPLGSAFGVGSVDWDSQVRLVHSQHIIELLQNSLGLATSLGVPAINTYQPSLDDSVFGSYHFTSAQDGIHYSPEGKSLVLDQITQSINLP